MPKHPENPYEVDVDDDKLRAYLERCRALIAEHGHMVQSIFGSGHVPAFSYTIGLSLAGGAELFTIGLPTDLATHTLNNVARRLARAPIPDYEDISEITRTPLRMRTSPIDAIWPYMRVAAALLPAPPRAVRQVIWPDPAGRFPGDPAYKYAVTQSIAELDPNLKPH